MPAKPKPNDPSDNAKFLFKGTVQKLNATTLAQVPKTDETAIVRVDEILHAPPALAKTLGKQITVKLAKGIRPKVGDQVLFHATGWLFGDSVAVESVKQEKPALAARTMLSEGVSDPAQNLAHRELQNRVADAEMVIEGEVSSIHLPQTESVFTASSANSAKPVSEHDPKWRDAVVSVGKVHKGEPGAKQVVVRFPSSTDVQWYRAPKFRTGDRGVWMLQHSKEPAGAGKAVRRKKPSKALMALTAIPEGSVYTALHPMDFQPANKLTTVGPVILTAVATKNS